MSRLVTIVSVGCALLLGNAFGQSTPLTTSVHVLDAGGNPIPDASIQVTYPDRSAQRYDTGRGSSDEDGRYAYSGRTFSRVYVVIQKQGFYESIYQQKAYRPGADGKRIFFDPEIEAVLKPIVNPIPMYARANFLEKIPAYDKPVGYDLMKDDWVSPYGEGRVSDLVFELRGTYQQWENHDCTLTLTFSNEGDGLIAFEGNEKEGSRLLSPHEAPEVGYLERKEWRRSITPVDGQRVHSYERIIEYDENLNYIVRVRTILDENGNIESAHYGKIYGDMVFDPTWERDSYLKFRAYYLNPTPNNRNIEFSVGESLIEGLRERDEPSLP